VALKKPKPSPEKASPVTQILIAVAIALLVGGSAPWWWGKLFPSDREEITSLTTAERAVVLEVGESKRVFVGRSSTNPDWLFLPPKERVVVLKALQEKGLLEFQVPPAAFQGTLDTLKLTELQPPAAVIGVPSRPPPQIFQPAVPITPEVRKQLETQRYFLSKEGLRVYRILQEKATAK
jgi:hypothetical protein